MFASHRAATRAAIVLALALATAPASAQGLTGEALAKAQANFKTADKAGTGKLDAAAFKAFIDLNAAAKIGRAPQIASNKAYDRAFSTVDANKDGVVTWDEYLKAQAR